MKRERLQGIEKYLIIVVLILITLNVYGAVTQATILDNYKNYPPFGCNAFVDCELAGNLWHDNITTAGFINDFAAGQLLNRQLNITFGSSFDMNYLQFSTCQLDSTIPLNVDIYSCLGDTCTFQTTWTNPVGNDCTGSVTGCLSNNQSWQNVSFDIVQANKLMLIYDSKSCQFTGQHIVTMSEINVSLANITINQLPTAEVSLEPQIYYTENSTDIVTFNISIDSVDLENDTLYYGFEVATTNYGETVSYFKFVNSPVSFIKSINPNFDFISKNYNDNTCNISETILDYEPNNLNLIQKVLAFEDVYSTPPVNERTFMLELNPSCIGGNKSYIQQLESPVIASAYENVIYGFDVGENLTYNFYNSEFVFLYGVHIKRQSITNMSIYDVGVDGSIIKYLGTIGNYSDFYRFSVLPDQNNSNYFVRVNLNVSFTTGLDFDTDTGVINNPDELLSYVELDFSQLNDNVYQSKYRIEGLVFQPTFTTTEPTTVDLRGFGKHQYILYLSDEINQPVDFNTYIVYANIEQKSNEIVINQEYEDAGIELSNSILNLCTGFNNVYDERIDFDTCLLVRVIVLVVAFVFATVILFITNIIFPIIKFEATLISVALFLWIGHSFIIPFSTGFLITLAVGFVVGMVGTLIKLMGSGSIA